MNSAHQQFIPVLTSVLLFVCSEDEEDPSAPTSVKPHPAYLPTRGHLQRIISIEEDHLPHLLHSSSQAQRPLAECSEADEALDSEEDIDLVMSDICPRASAAASTVAAGPKTSEEQTPTSQRVQPVGKETSVNVSIEEIITGYFILQNLVVSLK